jgi:hypothetical protein
MKKRRHRADATSRGWAAKYLGAAGSAVGNAALGAFSSKAIVYKGIRNVKAKRVAPQQLNPADT